MKLNSRNVYLNEINDITKVTIDLNKKIADKLRVNADFLLNKIEMEQENVSNTLLNKKRKPEETQALIEESNLTKAKLSKILPSEDKGSFKIELSLRDDIEEENEIENINHIDNAKNKIQDVNLNKLQNIDKNNTTTDALIKSKWSLKDQSKNEFVSTDKIVMILKDKKTFVEQSDKIINFEKKEIMDKNISHLFEKQEEITENIKNNTESDSESDSDSQIEIPDIF